MWSWSYVDHVKYCDRTVILGVDKSKSTHNQPQYWKKVKDVYLDLCSRHGEARIDRILWDTTWTRMTHTRFMEHCEMDGPIVACDGDVPRNTRGELDVSCPEIIAHQLRSEAEIVLITNGQIPDYEVENCRKAFEGRSLKRVTIYFVGDADMDMSIGPIFTNDCEHAKIFKIVAGKTEITLEK